MSNFCDLRPETAQVNPFILVDPLLGEFDAGIAAPVFLARLSSAMTLRGIDSLLRRLATVGTAIFLGASAAEAHRLDEYLQASLVSVDEDRIGIELSLTPGIEVIEWILPTIDPDGDGRVSETEATACAERVRTNLVLGVDSRELPLKLVDSRFPGIDEMKEGSGVIRLRFAADTTGLGSGAHRLLFQNTYLTNYSVYQANALAPSSRFVVVGKQERDVAQTRLEFEFTLPEPGGAAGSSTSGVSGIGFFLWVGVGVLVVSGWVLGRRRLVDRRLRQMP